MSSRARLALFVIAAVVTFTACSSSNPPGEPAEGPTADPKLSSEEFQQAITDDRLDAGPVLVGDEAGSTEFGQLEGDGLAIPADFPGDVPLLDNAHVTMVHRRGKQLMLGYSVPLPWQAASDALQDELRAGDWWIEDPKSEKGVSVFRAKRADGRSISLSVGDLQSGQTSLVVVTVAPGDGL